MNSSLTGAQTDQAVLNQLKQGLAHLDAGQASAALAVFEQVLARHAEQPDALHLSAVACMRQGDWSAATVWLERALQVAPACANYWNTCGALRRRQGRWDEALQAYQRSLALDPQQSDAHQNLALLLERMQRLPQALASWQKACELAPDSVSCLAQLVHLQQKLCRWDGMQERLSRLREMLQAQPQRWAEVPPFIGLMLDESPAGQLRSARGRAVLMPRVPALLTPAQREGRRAPQSRPLRIGYLSCDWHQHATAYLITGVLEHTDTSRFETFAYSWGPDDGGVMHQRLRRALTHFVEVGNLSLPTLAERIAADGIDILVDLKGYTHDTRSDVLAWRAAPVQVQFLGYPGTLGSTHVDYLLADAFIVPPEHRPHYTEAVVYLPHCYQPNDRQREIGAATRREDWGLPAQGVVFCSLNQTWKITPGQFAVWMAILQAVPGSVLWLLANNAWAGEALREQAVRHGVSPERIVMAEKVPVQDHLARLQLADVFLDTLPVNAHTSASDALWAGVPVLTCVGQSFAGRVAGSLLHCLGLAELVCQDRAAYRAQAIRLGLDTAHRQALRARVQQARQTSPLFDSARFARHLEAAYDAMWRRFQEGQPPAPFAVPVDDAALLRQAFALHQQGQWEAAQHGYAQLVQRHPDHVNAWQLWGVMLHQWGRHAEAVERLTRAIALRPRQADFYANRGVAFDALGRFDKALADHTTALNLQPSLAGAWANRGGARLALALGAQRQPVVPDGPSHSTEHPGGLGQCAECVEATIDFGGVVMRETLLRIFVGYDPVESVAWHTMVHSILSQSSLPVAIVPVNLTNLGGIYTRARHPKQSNAFSMSRFLVPHLCDYQGHALFFDCDMMLRGDISEILTALDTEPGKALYVVQHDYQPRNGTKYLGRAQYAYPRKNWSSMMLWNCAHPAHRVVTPEWVNAAEPVDLHRLTWLRDEEIGALDVRWNWLVGEYDDPPGGCEERALDGGRALLRRVVPGC